MHINIDTEKYDSLQQIVEVLDRLKGIQKRWNSNTSLSL